MTISEDDVRGVKPDEPAWIESSNPAGGRPYGVKKIDLETGEVTDVEMPKFAEDDDSDGSLFGFGLMVFFMTSLCWFALLFMVTFFIFPQDEMSVNTERYQKASNCLTSYHKHRAAAIRGIEGITKVQFYFDGHFNRSRLVYTVKVGHDPKFVARWVKAILMLGGDYRLFDIDATIRTQGEKDWINNGRLKRLDDQIRKMEEERESVIEELGMPC